MNNDPPTDPEFDPERFISIPASEIHGAKPGSLINATPVIVAIVAAIVVCIVAYFAPQLLEF